MLTPESGANVVGAATADHDGTKRCLYTAVLIVVIPHDVSTAAYRYDAIARLRDANLSRFLTEDAGRQDEVSQAAAETADRRHEEIERYLTLGPLGSALAPRSDPKDHRPRILLIDELDKSDVDLPNDLLNLFEEGTCAVQPVAVCPSC